MNDSRRNKRKKIKRRDEASIRGLHRPREKMLREFKTVKRMMTAIPKEPNDIPPFERKRLTHNHRKQEKR